MKNLSVVFVVLSSLIFSVTCSAQKSSDDPDNESLKVYIPNAFTPNQDGVNDVFRTVITGQEIEFYELRILSRSGKEVFFSNDPDEVWIGDVRSDKYLTSPTIYVYFLRMKTVVSPEIKSYTGHVTVIR